MPFVNQGGDTPPEAKLRRSSSCLVETLMDQLRGPVGLIAIMWMELIERRRGLGGETQRLEGANYSYLRGLAGLAFIANFGFKINSVIILMAASPAVFSEKSDLHASFPAESAMGNREPGYGRRHKFAET